MKRIAKFEKVSKENFISAIEEFGKENNKKFLKDEIEYYYQNLKLPERATRGSAGYDFFVPTFILLEPGETIKIPTGIRVKIEEGWVLKIYPRSSLGFKYRLMLNNTVGIIDQDYYYSDNEGHIFIKMTNCSSDKDIYLETGSAFAQGIFLEYGITEDDNAASIRNGGIGSTSKGE